MVEEKSTLKSLAVELEKKIAEDKENPEVIETKEEVKEVPDKDIEEASKKISDKKIKKEAKGIKENVDGKKETLIPLEDYIKCAVHLGTKVITPHMKKYVYKRRADGLAVINTALIDEKIREAIDFLNKYESDKIYLACKREAGWEAVKLFGEITGIKVFTKKYPPGVTTNLELDDFFEKDEVGNNIFKLISAKKHSVEIEYSRQYAVRDEHKGYEFTTIFELNETKEIMSMWGQEQVTYKITYEGLDEKTLKEAIDSNPVENYSENKLPQIDLEHKTLDDVVNQQDINNSQSNDSSQQNTIF